MKYSVINSTYLNRKEKIRVFSKWLLYALALIVSFMVMTSGVFQGWQPFFIIPLTLSVAMREDELSASIFAVLCGFIMDIATDNVFGFSGFFLLPAAMTVSLLVRNFIRPNIVNHFLVTAFTSAFMAGNEYLFKYFIWDFEGGDIVLERYIIPSYLSSTLIAPLFYLLATWIHSSFIIKENTLGDDSFEETEEEE